MSNINNLVFGVALEALKNGECIARAGWNGKNMFLYLNKGAVDSRSLHDAEGNKTPIENLGQIDGVSLSLFEAYGEGVAPRLPNINMQSASGATVTGWLASQTDMLANDWEILEKRG